MTELNNEILAGNKYQDYSKILRAIDSCEVKAQVERLDSIRRNFDKMYSDKDLRWALRDAGVAKYDALPEHATKRPAPDLPAEERFDFVARNPELHPSTFTELLANDEAISSYRTV